MSEQPAQWLTVTGAAALLGVSEKTLRKRIARGEVAAVRVSLPKGGWAWRVDAARLENSSRFEPVEGSAQEHLEGVRESPGSSSENVRELSSDDISTIPTDVTESTGTIHDSRLSRVEGYMARDLEMIVGRAVNEAVSSAVAPLLEEIKQLATIQAAQIAENAALRMEVELMASSQMAAHMAAVPAESRAEDTHEPPKAAIEEALDKSLKQVQEMSDEVDSLQAENERLRIDLAKTQRSWWQRFFFDP